MALRRRLRLAAAACALALASAACAAQPVQATDVYGHTVRLAAPARRVVSLAPHLTELMFAVGAGDRVVGTVEYADFPDAAKRLPRVGDSALLDLERIAALQPDLVLVWRHGNSPQQLQRLATLRLPTYASEARTLADIARTLRDLGVLAGTQAVAGQRAQQFEGAVAALRALRRPPAAAGLLSDLEPAADHHQRRAPDQSGARAVRRTQRVRRPEAADADGDRGGRAAGRPRRHRRRLERLVRPSPLARWRRLSALRAVRQGHLLQVDPDLLHRQSDRVVLGARELCEKLDAVRDTLR